jgi:hypothetical protein
MNKFTPGPWHSQLDGSDWGMPRNHAILSDGGELIAEIHSIQPYCAGESRQNIDRVMRDMANARLIAAAPDMMELLERTIARLEQWDRDNICNDDDLYTDLINTVAEIKEKGR